MKLTTENPPPTKLCLIQKLLASNFKSAVDRTFRFISGNHVKYVAQKEYKVPDSEKCLLALELVSKLSPDFMINHCMRSYAFGVAMAHKVNQNFDKEVFFLGSIMHDLGLTNEFDGTDTFELEGAKAAREFLLDHNIETHKADLVHEMIALHTSVGVAHKKNPEIALLHYGAGADVLGLWMHDINPKTLEEVLTEFPRLGFKDGIEKLIREQIEKKPKSYLSTLTELGFFQKVKNAPFPS